MSACTQPVSGGRRTMKYDGRTARLAPFVDRRRRSRGMSSKSSMSSRAEMDTSLERPSDHTCCACHCRPAELMIRRAPRALGAARRQASSMRFSWGRLFCNVARVARSLVGRS